MEPLTYQIKQYAHDCGGGGYAKDGSESVHKR
jgi:hypothetical protein